MWRWRRKLTVWILLRPSTGHYKNSLLNESNRKCKKTTRTLWIKSLSLLTRVNSRFFRFKTIFSRLVQWSLSRRSSSEWRSMSRWRMSSTSSSIKRHCRNYWTPKLTSRSCCRKRAPKYLKKLFRHLLRHKSFKNANWSRLVCSC